MSGKRKTKAHTEKPQRHDATASRTADIWRMIAIVVIALLVALRPLMSETYTSALHGIATAVGGAGDARDLSPAATAWIDLVIWAVALLVTLRLAIEKRSWRWTGLEPGTVFLLIGAIVSTICTGDRRTALNASADWLTAVVLIMIVAQIVRTRWAAHLILAAIVASGVASAARCVMFVTIEHDEMLREYEAHKEEIWSSQGIALDDPQVELFERRMLAREAGGFLPFTNAQGSLLLLCGFASFALGQRPAQAGWRRWVPWLVAPALWAAILLTGSKGAILALLPALAIWFMLAPRLDAIARHWRKAWILFWLAALGAVLLVALYGSWRGGLPTDSLRFRWNYWQVTRQIVADHLWTGTGALNFDRAYMRYKPIEFPEEVQDPHNYVVAILAQWGILGFAGLLLMMLGGSWVLFRGIRERVPCRDSTSDPEQPRQALPALPPRACVLILIAAFLLIRGLIIASTGGAAAGALVIFDLGIYGLLWCVVFAVMSIMADEPADDSRTRPGLLELAMAVGVLAFLLHNTIDFSLFIPATLTPWAAMLALLLARNAQPDTPCESHVARWTPPVIAGAGALVLLILVVIPVHRTGSLLTRARSTPMPQAADLYRRSAAADALDPTPWMELAERAARQSSDLDVPLDALKRAWQRDPHRPALYRQLAQVHHHRYDAFEDAERKLSELRSAVAAAEQARQLYPASPDYYAMLGFMRAELGVYTQDPAELERGIRNLQHALALDAAREEGEIRRKPPSWRAEITRCIHDLSQNLESLGTEVPSTLPQ